MVPPQPVRLVLFDLDGTVLDHEGATAAAVEQWLLGAGWATAGNISQFVVAWNEIAERHFPAYRSGRTTFQGQRRARLHEFLPHLGIDTSTWSDAHLDAVFDDYLVAYEAAWHPFPDAGPCLEALCHVVSLAVLSNGDQAQQEAKVARTGLGRYLDLVLTSSRLGAAKPDPSIFTRACHHLQVPPRTTMYVGDRLEVDAIAASTAGLHGVWLNRTGQQGLPEIETIDTLAQLPRMIGPETARIRRE